MEKRGKQRKREELHCELCVGLYNHLDSSMIKQFCCFLRPYISNVAIREAEQNSDILKLLHALERADKLAVGQYDLLLQIAAKIDKRMEKIIKDYQEKFKKLEASLDPDNCLRGNAHSENIINNWMNLVAQIVFHIHTNKTETDDALQRYVVDLFADTSTYPILAQVHAIVDDSVDRLKEKNIIKLKAASPGFTKAFCDSCMQEKTKNILEKILSDATKQISLIPWIKVEELNLNIEINCEKKDRKLHAEEMIESRENFSDFRRCLSHVHYTDLQYLLHHLVTQNIITERISSIDEVIDFFTQHPNKQHCFIDALKTFGYKRVAKIVDGRQVMPLLSEKEYKVYVSILNNYDILSQLKIGLLEECCLQLKHVIEILSLKDMNALLKQVLSSCSSLRAFIQGLNNASCERDYQHALHTLMTGIRFQDEEIICKHDLFRDIKEGALHSFMFAIPVFSIGTAINTTLNEADELKIRRNYSRLLYGYSTMSVLQKLVDKGIILPLVKYLIEEECDNDIKMDMVLKSLLRSEPTKFKAFLCILRSATVELKEMASLIGNEDEQSSGLRIDEALEIQNHQCKSVEAMECFIRENSHNEVCTTGYLVENFLHPFFEERIISKEQHDRVFYEEGSERYTAIANLIAECANQACKKYKWIEKYDSFVKILQQNTPEDEKGEERHAKIDEEYTGVTVHLACSVKGVIKSMYDIFEKAMDYLHKTVAGVHCVVDEITSGSINIKLKSPSPIFYNKFKSMCESTDIQEFLKNVLQTFINEDISVPTFTVEVEITILYNQQYFSDEVTTRKDPEEKLAHKLQNCRMMLTKGVFVSDIEAYLLECGVIEMEILNRIMQSNATNTDKMEDIITYIEQETEDVFQTFIKALRSAGYRGIAKVLDGSCAKLLKSLPEYKLRMCMLDNYQMLTDEIHMDKLKMASVQLRRDIERIQEENQNPQSNSTHLLLNEILLDKKNLLRVFIDAMSNDAYHHHILKKMEYTAASYKDLEISKEDKVFIFRAKVKISTDGNSEKRRDESEEGGNNNQINYEDDEFVDYEAIQKKSENLGDSIPQSETGKDSHYNPVSSKHKQDLCLTESCSDVEYRDVPGISADAGNFTFWQSKGSLEENICYMFDKEIACDVTFCCRKGDIRAHRMVLKSRYPKLLKDIDSEGLVNISNTEEDVFGDMIQYIYFGTVDILHENVVSLLCVASKYGVRKLSQRGKDLLLIDETRALEFYEKSHQCGVEDLHEKFLKYIQRSKQPEKFLLSKYFTYLCPDCCDSIIQSDKFFVKEELVFEAMIRWADANCQSIHEEITNGKRREILGKLLYKIRFPLMDAKYFHEHVQNDNLLSEEEIAAIITIRESQFEDHRSLFSNEIRYRGAIDSRKKYEGEKYETEKSFSTALCYMLDEEISCDTEFLVPKNLDDEDEKVVLKAHRVVLIARSPVFQAMLDGPLEEKGPIKITDIDADIFKMCLRRMYQDTPIDLTMQNVIPILYAAKKYILDFLTKDCRTYLEQNLSVDNFYEIIEYADYLDEMTLQNDCMQAITCPEIILNDERFQGLSSTSCSWILSSDYLGVREEFVYEAAIRWAEAKCQRENLNVNDENKRNVLGEILFKIRFPLMEEKYFADHVLVKDLLTLEEKLSVMEGHYGIENVSECLFSKSRRKTRR